MDTLSHGRIIGIDVSRDWLDLHCLPDGHRCRVPNTPVGHAAVADLARNTQAVVCFESTGGQEWQLWALLEAEGVAARQVPPAQVKAFAQSRGTRAKTDRIDAELIARFFAFRPEAGRSLPAGKLRLLRALTSKRAQLVEMRKRLLAQIRAHQKLGTAVMFEDIDRELKQRFDSMIKDLEDRITRAIANDDHLSDMAIILRSIPGIGPVASTMPPLVHVNMHCRAVDRRNARDRHNHRRGGRCAHWIGPGCTRQRNPARKTGHRGRPARSATRHVPSCLGRITSQSKPESLRRSPP
jgi:transposase